MECGRVQASWALPLSLSDLVDTKTMHRLRVEGTGWGRVRLRQHDCDDTARLAHQYVLEREEHMRELGVEEDLDVCSVMARIIQSRHMHRTRP